MTPECKKMLLVAIVLTIITFSAFYIADNTLGSLFKNHNTTDTPASITDITVTGDGSSGTGDVQNVQQVNQVTVQGNDNNVEQAPEVTSAADAAQHRTKT